MSKSRSKNKDISHLQKAGQGPAHSDQASGNIELQPEQNLHEIELERQNAELLATQEKLTTALQEYSELFEHSPVGYFILDNKGAIENVNARGASQVGIDKHKLIGKHFYSFLNTESGQEYFRRLRDKAVAEGNLERMECVIRKKDGSVFSAFIKFKVVKDGQQQFKHLLTMVTDISTIKEHEHQVELQLKQSEELNIMKSRFIAMASHEFRTPLTTMLSSTALVERYAELGETEKMNRHLTRIKGNIANLTSILDEFLSIERLESGKVEVQRKNCNLPAFCANMIEDFAGIKKNGQSINYIHQGEEEIYEDEKILQHILVNLLSNACKYSTGEKEIKLSTSVTDQVVTMVVADEGIGIPDAEQANVFSRFFRAQNTATIPGTGLGLNIVQRYVELLNGNIGFVSRHHEGTTFMVEFPRKLGG